MGSRLAAFNHKIRKIFTKKKKKQKIWQKKAIKNK